MSRLFALAVLLAAASPEARASGLGGAARWAAFYGAEISSEAWLGLDMAVVDPENTRPPRTSTGPVRLAYVSAGEAEEDRGYWKKALGKDFLIEKNPDWPGDHRADLRSAQWRKLVSSEISSAIARGYQGIMLDTLDVADYLESSAPARFQGSREAAAAFVRRTKADHPGSFVLVNNGLYLLDSAGAAIDGVVVEDLYTRCAPKDKACRPASAAESRSKEERLRRFFLSERKPVFVILYARLKQRGDPWIRNAVARCRALGFFPYVASPELDRLGVVAPAAK